MQIKSYGDEIFKISDLIPPRMALFHQICKNLDFEKSLLWVKTTFKMSENDFKTIQTLFKVVLNSIDIISDHFDHLWVKVERYRPVQVIKCVCWRLREVYYPSYYHCDDLNGSIPFHFYSQMVGMIRYDIYAIKNNFKKCLDGFEIIFWHFASRFDS